MTLCKFELRAISMNLIFVKHALQLGMNLRKRRRSKLRLINSS